MDVVSVGIDSFNYYGGIVLCQFIGSLFQVRTETGIDDCSSILGTKNKVVVAQEYTVGIFSVFGSHDISIPPQEGWYEDAWVPIHPTSLRSGISRWAVK
jgi:hypothetical protein